MQSSFSVFANYPATKPCLILSKANQSHLNSLSVKLSHMYKNALTWMSTSLSDLFPCSVHVPIRSLKVNCTLHRCHKERKFRSRRTVRSVCACAFFFRMNWHILLLPSSCYIRFLSSTRGETSTPNQIFPSKGKKWRGGNRGPSILDGNIRTQLFKWSWMMSVLFAVRFSDVDRHYFFF